MKNRISLSQIINLFSIFLFFIFISYVYFDIKNIFRTLKEVEKEKMITYLKTEASIISPLIYFGFKEEVKHEFNKMLSDIEYIKVVSKNFVYETGKRDNLEFIKVPIVYKGKKIGEIFAGYNDKKFLNSFFHKYLRKLIIYLILGFLLFLIIYFYLGKKVNSLNKLAKKIEKIDFRKIKGIELLDNYYEIVNITNSINKLLSQINSFYSHQKRLIKKITLYKKQLETAQKLAEMFTFSFDCESKKFETQNFHIGKVLGFKDVDEFINSIIEKDLFFEKLKEICQNLNEFEIELKVKSFKKNYYFRVMAKIVKSNKKNIVIGTFINITDEVKQQERIEFLAYHDPLTGLINRTFFKEQLQILMELATRHNKKLALVFIDLDNFKMINDSFGHEAGDELLIEVANRLKKSVRKSDVIARIGGDEFVLILNDIVDRDDVKKVLEKIKDNFKPPVILKKHKVEISFSAGVAIFPDDADSIEKLLQYADIAMYESKRKGKNRYSFISKNLQEEVKEFYTLIDELKEALRKDNELVLFFQPKVDIKNNKVSGVEALIRWNHPTKGLLTPFYFIDKAEKAGLISLIDSYVLRKGVRTLKKWENNKDLKNLTIAINISAVKFNELNFIEEIKNLIETYKIDPSKLQIEITETLSMQNLKRTLEVLEKIKSLGIKIALDDFGTGYSSLSYLKKIPFDVLKIDQVFVKDLLKDDDDFKITQMIVEIGKILNKTLVAEGVENRKILEEIKKLGVYIIQGYFFAKPMSENDLKTFVANFDEKNYK